MNNKTKQKKINKLKYINNKKIQNNKIKSKGDKNKKQINKDKFNIKNSIKNYLNNKNKFINKNILQWIIHVFTLLVLIQFGLIKLQVISFNII